MKLDPADHERYIDLEISSEELALLGDLLRIETIYQIKKQVALDGEVEDRVGSIINTFGLFQDFDTQIKDLQTAYAANQKKLSATESNPMTNMVVISKNRVKIYHFLCTKTVELVIPVSVKLRCEELGPSLTKKLEIALSSPSLLDSNPVEDIDSNVKINMLGQRGIA